MKIMLGNQKASGKKKITRSTSLLDLNFTGHVVSQDSLLATSILCSQVAAMQLETISLTSMHYLDSNCYLGVQNPQAFSDYGKVF